MRNSTRSVFWHCRLSSPFKNGPTLETYYSPKWLRADIEVLSTTLFYQEKEKEKKNFCSNTPSKSY